MPTDNSGNDVFDEEGIAEAINISGGDGDDDISIDIRSDYESYDPDQDVIRGTATVTGDAGNDTISANASDSDVLINAGDGDDEVTLEGNDFGTLNATIYAGSGADTINMEVNTGVIDLGPTGSMSSFEPDDGVDRVVLWSASGSQSASIVVRDFQAGEGGDVIEIPYLYDLLLLSGWDGGSNPYATGLLSFDFDGNDWILALNAEGEKPVVLVTLQGLLGSTAFVDANFEPSLPLD